MTSRDISSESRVGQANAARLAADRARAAALRDLLLNRFQGRGLTAGAVARQLNGEGVAAPRGGPWSARQVLRLVTLVELAQPLLAAPPAAPAAPLRVRRKRPAPAVRQARPTPDNPKPTLWHPDQTSWLPPLPDD